MRLQSQTLFLRKYGISRSQFRRTNLKWSALEAMYIDHAARLPSLQTYEGSLSAQLRLCTAVHSVRSRIKDPEHLVEKVIRKTLADPTRHISIDTYHREITDILGARVLHLYKEDWLPIDRYIRENWEPIEKPTAYVREGDLSDTKTSFSDNGCNVVIHPAGYRSVHYLVELQLTRHSIVAEIQVRTLFEEAWSEIDHALRYPSHVNDPLVNQLLVVFNRLAGGADELGSFVRLLKSSLVLKSEVHRRAVEDRDARLSQLSDELRRTIGELGISKKEKDRLRRQVQSLNAVVSNDTERIGGQVIQGIIDPWTSPAFAYLAPASYQIAEVSLPSILQANVPETSDITSVYGFKSESGAITPHPVLSTIVSGREGHSCSRCGHRWPNNLITLVCSQCGAAVT